MLLSFQQTKVHKPHGHYFILCKEKLKAVVSLDYLWHSTWWRNHMLHVFRLLPHITLRILSNNIKFFLVISDHYRSKLLVKLLNSDLEYN